MWSIAAVTLLTAVAALVRIPLLSQPMGADESATFLYYASHPLPIALTIYGSPNNHILHSALMHLSFRMFGGAEWALRLPAFLAGVALVPLTYWTSRNVAPALSRRGRAESPSHTHGALIAAALSATAPVLIDYSTDARGYTMLCCFVLLCTAAMAEITRSGKRSAIVLFSISAALGFYTVPVMLYPFAMLVVWGLITPRRREAAIASVAAAALTIILYVPVMFVSGVSMLTSNPYVRAVPRFLQNALPYLDTVRLHLFVGIPLVLQILIGIGVVVAIARRALPPMWIGIIAVIALVAIQRVLPFPRVWLPLLVLLFITAAASWPWGERSESLIAAAVAVALTITGMATPRLRETGELRAVHEITRTLNLHAQKGDPVLALSPSEMPLAFYCPRVEVLRPDVSRPRLFAIENRDYGKTLPMTLAYFRIDPRRYAIRRIRDFGSSALYELRR